MSKRILIPILGFAAQGGYRVLSELANTWIRQGYDCTFLVPATSPEPYFPTDAKVLRSDWRGRITDHHSGKNTTGRDNILSLWTGLRKIGKDYDVILANHSLTAWPVALANCGKAKKLYYIQAHETGYYTFLKDPIKHVLARGSYKLNLLQISNSGGYVGAGLNPKDFIPPGIDLDVFTPKQDDQNLDTKSEIILGTIGRSEPYKGTDIAIAAYRAMRKSDPRLRLHVAFGNITPADDLKIIPLKGDVQLAAFYRSVDVLIVSCIGQNGAPHYPLIEAMASGTPVVQTGYYPGTAENTWLAADNSTAAVTQALRDLLYASPAVRRQRIALARETVARSLTWDAVATKFTRHFS